MKPNDNSTISLPEGTKIPLHVAIIPDGNMRWGKENGKTYMEALDAGAEVIKSTLDLSRQFGIRYFTVWGFSTENWKRDPKFVAYMMKKLLRLLMENREKYIQEGVRISHLGSIKNLPKALVNELRAAKNATKDCTRYFFNIAWNYGGRNEILRAVQKIMRKGYKAKQVTEELIDQMLDTAGMPDPDLIIRTSGEQRLSGLLPWQSTYAELYFSPKYWPEFSAEDYKAAIIDYSNRDRRFGGQSKTSQKES